MLTKDSRILKIFLMVCYTCIWVGLEHMISPSTLSFDQELIGNNWPKAEVSKWSDTNQVWKNKGQDERDGDCIEIAQTGWGFV